MNRTDVNMVDSDLKLDEILGLRYSAKRKDIHYVIDANAGKHRTGRVFKELQKFAPYSTFTVIRNEQELDEIFSVPENTTKVYVAVGGDGTVRKVMKHIQGTIHFLGIIPVGSENKIARELGISGNVEMIVKTFEQAEATYVDILKVNNHRGFKTAALGFEAECAYRYARLGIRGLVGHVFGILQSICFFKPFYVKMSFEWTKIEGVYWMVSIEKPDQCGNNACIYNNAFNRGKLIGIVLVEPFPPLMFPVFLFKMITGKLRTSKYVKYIQTCGPISVQCTHTRLHIDGYPGGEIDGTLDFSLVLKAIQVILPVKAEKGLNG